ncbi:hypothetical protein [Nonomuraea sp. SBT364]|nr:hypothetical protein [Nonomuraea sp. SBT364]
MAFELPQNDGRPRFDEVVHLVAQAVRVGDVEDERLDVVVGGEPRR